MDSQPPSFRSGRFDETSSSKLTKSASDASSIQNLSSILNNPHAPDASSWVVGTWWGSTTSSVAPPEFNPITNNVTRPPDPTRGDFKNYVTTVSEPFSKFEEIRNHSIVEEEEGLGGVEGEALVACLREVPALYFKEDFELEDGATFRSACPFTSISENVVLQEKLSQYLDVVELHLVREISLRSSSFFEAQGQLEDLNGKIVDGCGWIRELKETIRLLDTDLVGSARQVQELSLTRGNLLALQQKLRLILYVNQALSALNLLVASGDCAGALDVTDDLRHLLDGDELTGLHCFRHLRDHVAAAVESVYSILSAEFLRVSIHGGGDMDALLLTKSEGHVGSAINGEDDHVKLHGEDAFNFEDSLLPLVIGLLRTAKLPAVLRIYRDTLTAHMKAVIKSVVADMLPVLVTRPLESDFALGERNADVDGGGSSLASKLRSLSSESFIQLLSSIYSVVRAHLLRAAEVKKAIEHIMCNLDGHYAADSVAAAIAHGALAAESAQEADGQLTSFLPLSQKNAIKVPTPKGNDAVSLSNMSKNFRADVLRENTEAVFAACDAAQGRWAKLLGVRVLLHRRLRLQDFLQIYSISLDFISATEKIGGRLGYSIRGTLQSQAKAFVDFQHESRMTKIKAVLDQETWVEVDVPNEFQTIINSLFTLEPLIDGQMNGSIETAHSEEVPGSNISLSVVEKGGLLSNSHQQIDQPPKSVEASAGNTEQNISNKSKEHGISASHMLSFRGVGYHMVNCGLILLKMLSEYIDMNTALPALSPEVIHRVVEILKFFNTRTCQLVLGAGAMQVSGLKSITSKHLALASQVISFIQALIPEIRRVLFLKVPEARKGLLSSEMERVSQDYKVHRDEIHSKLVQIMRERLLVHIRGLPQIVETWNRADDADTQPSQFARSLTKEVGYLQRVLSRTLHEADVQEIFREVILIFHSQISEAFSHIEISTPQAKTRLYRDIQHILQCIRSLPSAKLSDSDSQNFGQLDILAQKFAPEVGE